jgi:GT2 family glycosyltransferase
LNEGLFAYYEDTDYSIRSINAGFLNIMVYDSAVLHDSPIESGLRKPHYYYYMYRNDILIRRNYIKSLVMLLKVLLWNFLRIRRSILQFKAAPQLAEACLAGLWDGWLGVTGVYRPGRRMPAVVRRFVLAFGPNSSLQRTDSGLCR